MAKERAKAPGPSGVAKKRPWTVQEDELLLEAVRQEGTKRWAAIALRLGRPNEAVRLRWQNVLNPATNKAPFSEWEQAVIVLAQPHYNNQWSQISSLLPGRTPYAVKNHWYNTLNRKVQKNCVRNRFISPGTTLEAVLAQQPDDTQGGPTPAAAALQAAGRGADGGGPRQLRRQAAAASAARLEQLLAEESQEGDDDGDDFAFEDDSAAAGAAGGRGRAAAPPAARNASASSGSGSANYEHAPGLLLMGKDDSVMQEVQSYAGSLEAAAAGIRRTDSPATPMSEVYSGLPSPGAPTGARTQPLSIPGGGGGRSGGAPVGTVPISSSMPIPIAGKRSLPAEGATGFPFGSLKRSHSATSHSLCSSSSRLDWQGLASEFFPDGADGPAGNGFQDALLLASPGLPGADALADDQAAAAMQLPLRARSASLGHSMQSAHSASMLAHSLPSSSMPMAVLGGAAGSSLGHSGNRLGPLAQSLDARDPGAFELDQALQAARRAEQARLAVAELAAAGLGLGSSWLLGPEAALALAGGGGGGGVPRVMSMPASMYSISEQGEDGGCRPHRAVLRSRPRNVFKSPAGGDAFARAFCTATGTAPWGSLPAFAGGMDSACPMEAGGSGGGSSAPALPGSCMAAAFPSLGDLFDGEALPAACGQLPDSFLPSVLMEEPGEQLLPDGLYMPLRTASPLPVGDWAL